MWVGAYLKVARQYRPLFSIHDALRRRGRRVSTGSVSIHNTLIRNAASLVRRTQTLQLKCIKRNYITKSSRIH